MIIGFDGKRAVENNTGLGNYSRLLIEELSEAHPDNRYLIYAPRYHYNPRMLKLMRRLNVDMKVPLDAGGALSRSMWRSRGITKSLIADKIDLFHGLSGELPLNIRELRKPSVLTVHDLIFLRYPQYYHKIDRKLYDYKYRRSCLNATRVIAISERTKADIMEFYHVPEEKIDVIYQGCHRQFLTEPTPEDIDTAKAKYGITRPYIITVGTVEARKNQMMAVRGINGLPEEIQLVIVGRRTSYADELDRYIKAYNMKDRVKFIDKVDFADLPALYAGALCSSYTSRYEGFGIPVIESLNAGCPVIVATDSCLEEAGGPATPAVPPDDISEWMSTVKEFIDYPASRRSVVRQGREYVKRFAGENFARNIMETYQRAIDDFR